MFVKRKAFVFYFEYLARIASWKMIARHPRGSGTDSSGNRGGAGATNEGKQKAFVPPPAGRAGRVPREVFRGK